MKGRKRILILLPILLLVLAAVFLCLSIPGKEPIILSYWTHEDDSREALELRLISEFESMNPGIKIERRVYTSSELFSIVPAAFEVGAGADIFSIVQTSLDPMIQKGYLAEYPGGKASIESKYISGVLDGAMYEGRLYGLPMEYTNWALYLNLDVVEKAGIDISNEDLSTWEGIRSLSEKLVEREDDILIRRGFDFRYPYYLNFFIPMVNQLGGSIGEEDGYVSIENEKAWEEVFDFFREWGPLGDNLGSPTYINARTVFPKGECAMMLSGLYHEKRLENDYPEFYESGKWKVLPFPVFENSISPNASAKYCHYWCVNDSIGEHKKAAAWKFLEFLSDHAGDYIDEVRLLLPRKEVIEKLDVSSIPYLDVFLSDLERSDFIYAGPESEEIRYLLEESIKNVMLGGESSAVAVERLRIAFSNLSL